ncbi:helix-turn-helix domain-containing protein [Halomonas garicola]|uniref:helix-turn-helix domain-containing protein n=1 Tax=Halomonas garicola TaxID=1690008 RepID=UPI002898D4F8|nr:helix-turn-helix transcriptional regulator [Halomonas garicola]
MSMSALPSKINAFIRFWHILYKMSRSVQQQHSEPNDHPMPKPSTIHDQRYQKAIQTIINARKKAGLSQSDLAQLVGFTQPDISKIERLERRLDITECIDILNAISSGEKDFFNKIWNSIHECHYR